MHERLVKGERVLFDPSVDGRRGDFTEALRKVLRLLSPHLSNAVDLHR
jgi:hypothetical protein